MLQKRFAKWRQRFVKYSLLIELGVCVYVCVWGCGVWGCVCVSISSKFCRFWTMLFGSNFASKLSHLDFSVFMCDDGTMSAI